LLGTCRGPAGCEPHICCEVLSWAVVVSCCGVVTVVVLSQLCWEAGVYLGPLVCAHEAGQIACYQPMPRQAEALPAAKALVTPVVCAGEEDHKHDGRDHGAAKLNL
jgi:hypothetical protein